MTDPIERLTSLGHSYRLIRESRRTESSSSRRRRLARDMEQLAGQFERLLDHWVHERRLKRAWRAFLRRGGPLPDAPRLPTTPLFRGLTEAGAHLEIVPAAKGGYDLVLDNVIAEHHEVPWHLEPEIAEPVRIGDWICREIFDASPGALAALAAFTRKADGEPPWIWARELYADGLIDADFALTARGLRRVNRPSFERHDGASYCVLLASAARVRVLVLSPGADIDEPDVLREVADTRDPEARARDSERLRDTRPGLRREGGHGPRHAVSDRREGQRRNRARRFAEDAITEAGRVWSAARVSTIILVAAPAMLGVLRPVLARRVRPPHRVVEHPRDLSRLNVTDVHEALARAEILPPRQRPPLEPSAGLGR